MTIAYDELCRRTRERDRSLREKVMSLEEAAALVPDAALVGIGGSTLSRTPMAMIWALIRAGRKDLVCCRSITSSEGELLFASGASRHILTSWFSQGIVWGVSRVMRLYTESGRARFEEWSHMAVGLRFRAGAMGVPFLPMRSMIGSDLIGQLPDARQIDCPFTGEKLVLVPALNPDVALIHVQRCDVYGNAQIDGLPFMDLDLALAANRVILTTERIVSNDQIRRSPDQTKIPFLAVDAVVDSEPSTSTRTWASSPRRMRSWKSGGISTATLARAETTAVRACPGVETGERSKVPVARSSSRKRRLSVEWD